jgi:alpha-mannosidase
MFQREFDDLGIKLHVHCEVTKYLVCENCSGNGCEVCNHTGLDYSYKNTSYYTGFDDIFKKVAYSEFDIHRVVMFSEEILKEDDFYERMETLANKYNVDLEYCTNIEFYEKNLKKQIQTLRTGEVDESQIDLRLETSEAAKGCCTTHIALKQMNRKLENMLFAAEKFAAFAVDMGDSEYKYPRKKIAYLWNKMALIQFHDAITASSIDAVVDELKAIGKNVALGAEQIFLDAAKVIEGNIEIEDKESYKPFVVFNPLNWTVKDNITEAVLTADKDFEIGSIDIINTVGKSMEVIDYKVTERQTETRITVRFKGAELPSLGYGVFYYKISEVGLKPMDIVTEQFIENEFYKVLFNKRMITSVLDKELGKEVLHNIDLVVEEDVGDSWGRRISPQFCESITKPYYLEYVTKRDYTVSREVLSDDNRNILIFTGEYKSDDRKIRSLKWKQTVILYNGIKKIYFKTELDWDGQDHRIKALFPLNFKPVDDEAYYEVPYGTVKRYSYSLGRNGEKRTDKDDWCAVNFSSVYNEADDYTVTLINKGIPRQKVIDGVMQLSLLRSPTYGSSLFAFDKAKEIGQHTMEYFITSGTGDLKKNNTVRTGAELNAHYYSYLAKTKKGKLKSEHSFLANQNENIIISAVKRGENDNKLVFRAYEVYGETVEDNIEMIDGSVELTESDLLEKKSEKVDKMYFKGFDIKTYKL